MASDLKTLLLFLRLCESLRTLREMGLIRDRAKYAKTHKDAKDPRDSHCFFNSSTIFLNPASSRILSS